MAIGSILAGKHARVVWSVAILLLVALTAWGVSGAVGQQKAPTAAPPAPSPVGHTAQLAVAPRPQGQAQEQAQPAVVNRCPKTATACVDEQLRISWLQRDGKIVYGPVPVMPGTKGAADSVATPKGDFHFMYKDADHVSSEFNEPMQHAVFFAPGGIAFHQGSLVSTSHGCVHLSPKDATHYFDALGKGAEISVF